MQTGAGVPKKSILAENSGFRSKTVEVTSLEPVMEDYSLGVVPRSRYQEGAPMVRDGFYPSTKDKPTYLDGFQTDILRVKGPLTDESGRAQIRQVTENIVVPGPKGQILAEISHTALSAVPAAIAGSLLGGAVGLFMDFTPFGGFGDQGRTSAAIGAGLGALAAVVNGVSAVRSINETNTLSLEEKPVTKSILSGFEVENTSRNGTPWVEVEPVLNEISVGTQTVPTKNW